MIDTLKKTGMIVIAGMVIFISISCNSKSTKESLKEEIQNNEKSLFGNSLVKFNDSLAVAVYHQYLQYAGEYTNDTLSAEYLFRAADLATGLKRPAESIRHYTELQEKYPQHSKASTAGFMIAFTYETVMGDKEKAKEAYLDFIQKYPEHALVPSAKASYEQLESGITDEELIRMFQAKEDSLAKAAQ